LHYQQQARIVAVQKTKAQQTAPKANSNTANGAVEKLVRLLARQAAQDYWAELQKETHIDNDTNTTSNLHGND